jgi:hypothetical protein
MPEIVTKAALAEELQCAKSHISKLISRGMPVRDDGKVDIEQACRFIMKHVEQGAAIRSNAMVILWSFDPLPPKRQGQCPHCSQPE